MNKSIKLLIIAISCTLLIGCSSRRIYTLDNINLIEDSKLCVVSYNGFWGTTAYGWVKNSDIESYKDNSSSVLTVYSPIIEESIAVSTEKIDDLIIDADERVLEFLNDRN